MNHNMKKLFLPVLLAFSLFTFIGCQSYGKRVKINEHLEVFAKKEATEEEAKKLGEYLQTLNTENKEQKSIQLEKEKETYSVRMVVGEDALKDKQLEASFSALQYLIKENVFPGKTVKLILTDDSFNDKKTVPEMSTVPSDESTPASTDSTSQSGGTDSSSAQ
jgi:hypothetical protein